MEILSTFRGSTKNYRIKDSLFFGTDELIFIDNSSTYIDFIWSVRIKRSYLRKIFEKGSMKISTYEKTFPVSNSPGFTPSLS
jgi:hypothetical protein